MNTSKHLALHALVSLGLAITVLIVGQGPWMEMAAIFSTSAACLCLFGCYLLIRERKTTDGVIEKSYEIMPDELKPAMEEIVYKAGMCPRSVFDRENCRDPILTCLFKHCPGCGLNGSDGVVPSSFDGLEERAMK